MGLENFNILEFEQNYVFLHGKYLHLVRTPSKVRRFGRKTKDSENNFRHLETRRGSYNVLGPIGLSTFCHDILNMSLNPVPLGERHSF
jgi:hypothetical protein